MDMNTIKPIILTLVLSVAIVSACEKETNPQSTTVTDVEGHTYSTVVVGDQVWMAENLCCTTYDTESERAGEVIPESSGVTRSLKPFYVDSKIKSKWTDGGRFSENMTDELISKSACCTVGRPLWATMSLRLVMRLGRIRVCAREYAPTAGS